MKIDENLKRQSIKDREILGHIKVNRTEEFCVSRHSKETSCLWIFRCLLKCFSGDVSRTFCTYFLSRNYQTSQKWLDGEPRNDSVSKLCHGWFSFPYKCESTCDLRETICWKAYGVLAEFLHKTPLNTRVKWWIINEKYSRSLPKLCANRCRW